MASLPIAKTYIRDSNPFNIPLKTFEHDSTTVSRGFKGGPQLDRQYAKKCDFNWWY